MSIRIPRTPQAVWRAIRTFGSQEAMGREIDVEQQTISSMGKGDRPVPAELCPVIERKTREIAQRKGDPSLIVPCEELRPDVEWWVLRNQEHPKAAQSREPQRA